MIKNTNYLFNGWAATIIKSNILKHKTSGEMIMEEQEKKSINHFVRSLHRDIGFFVIGLTIIYSISGIVLTYRNTNFLKHETLIEKTLSPNMEASELGKVLHLRDLKVLKSEGEIEYFQNVTYNKITGLVKYSKKELPLSPRRRQVEKIRQGL